MDYPIAPRRVDELMKRLQAEEANNSISQSDGITIVQSEADAPGFYVDQYQQQQDAYNQMMLRQQADGAYDRQEDMYYAPPRANAFDISVVEMAAGNPNYRVVEGVGNVGVNASGHIVRY